MQLVITPELSKRLIEQLKQSGWYNATLKRYAQHSIACESLDVQPEIFGRFAIEVLSTPVQNRASLFEDMRETHESEYQLRDLTKMYERMMEVV